MCSLEQTEELLTGAFESGQQGFRLLETHEEAISYTKFEIMVCLFDASMNRITDAGGHSLAV